STAASPARRRTAPQPAAEASRVRATWRHPHHASWPLPSGGAAATARRDTITDLSFCAPRLRPRPDRLDFLLEAHAGRRGGVLAPAVDLAVSRTAVETDRLVLVHAGFEHRTPRAELAAGGLETREDLLGHALPAQLGIDVHALHLHGS